MNMTIDITRLNSIEEVKGFLQANQNISLTINSKKDKYDFIRKTLVKFRYNKLNKKDKGVIICYLTKLTEYSDTQTKRLIREWKSNGLKLKDKKKNDSSFERIYKKEDIALLMKTDIAHNFPNGKSVKETLRREYEVFRKNEYKNISNISVSHIYNIRNHNRQYNSSETLHYTKTNPTPINIGERRKPQPNGKPGYLRVDSVHQGDLDGKKGVYHINIVDEVTQHEIIGCVEKISEYFLKGLIEDLLEQFPYKIINFHSDNGKEYINKTVSSILNKLLIDQTKSQPRKSTHNALVEGKNGSVIRKNIGRNHIPQKYAPVINEFYKKYFNDYLNYHRPCIFATDYTNKKGKVKKKYNTCMTPYEKLKSLPNANQYLKEGITFEILDKIAYDESDNEFAEKMKKAKEEMFKNLQN
jgi:hypothetical protein